MKNLSYHNKLNFKDPFSWDQEDFSGFLVWDQIEAFKSVADLRPGILQTAKSVTQKYNKYKFVLDIYDRFFQKLCFKNSKRKKIKYLDEENIDAMFLLEKNGSQSKILKL